MVFHILKRRKNKVNLRERTLKLLELEEEEDYFNEDNKNIFKNFLEG